MNSINNNNTMGGAPNTNPMAGNTGAGAAGHGDYGDKAFDAIAKKSGHNINPSTSEKITDTARGLFEKTTGLAPLLSTRRCLALL